jgi:hypothetical protein
LGLHATLSYLIEEGAVVSVNAAIWHRYFQQYPNEVSAAGLQPLLHRHRGIAWQASIGRLLPPAHAHVAARRGRRRRPGSFSVQLAGGGSRQPPLAFLNKMQLAAQEERKVILATPVGTVLAEADGACHHPGAVLAAGALQASLFGDEARLHTDLCLIDGKPLLLRQVLPGQRANWDIASGYVRLQESISDQGAVQELGSPLRSVDAVVASSLFLLCLFSRDGNGQIIATQQPPKRGVGCSDTEVASHMSDDALRLIPQAIEESFKAFVQSALYNNEVALRLTICADPIMHANVPESVRRPLEDLSIDAIEVGGSFQMLSAVLVCRGMNFSLTLPPPPSPTSSLFVAGSARCSSSTCI